MSKLGVERTWLRMGFMSAFDPADLRVIYADSDLRSATSGASYSLRQFTRGTLVQLDYEPCAGRYSTHGRRSTKQVGRWTQLSFPSVCHVAVAHDVFRWVPAVWDY